MSEESYVSRASISASSTVIPFVKGIWNVSKRGSVFPSTSGS